MLYQLLNRAAPVFWQVIQVYCFNQSRQREKLEFEIESLATHMRVAVSMLSKENDINGGKRDLNFDLKFLIGQLELCEVLHWLVGQINSNQ